MRLANNYSIFFLIIEAKSIIINQSQSKSKEKMNIFIDINYETTEDIKKTQEILANSD